jgi:hypothetical protein
MRSPLLIALAFLVLVVAEQRSGKLKVFFDQDVMASNSNMLSLLMMLRNPDIDLVGVGVTSGDR